jgi:hypothetical protein
MQGSIWTLGGVKPARPKEWKDQFKAHGGNLTAMEAQRLAGLPRVKSNLPLNRSKLMPELSKLIVGAT